MFRIPTFKKSLSIQERLEALFDFLKGSDNNTDQLFSLFFKWFYGCDFEWQTLSPEEAQPRLRFFGDKKNIDLLFWAPRTKDEWKDALNTYLPELRLETQTIFDEEVLPFLKEAKAISCEQVKAFLINLGTSTVLLYEGLKEKDRLKHVIAMEILRFINPSFVKQCAFCGKYFYSSRQNKIFCQRKCAIRAQQKKLEQKPEWRKKRRLYMRKYMRDYRRDEIDG